MEVRFTETMFGWLMAFLIVCVICGTAFVINMRYIALEEAKIKAGIEAVEAAKKLEGRR